MMKYLETVLATTRHLTPAAVKINKFWLGDSLEERKSALNILTVFWPEIHTALFIFANWSLTVRKSAYRNKVTMFTIHIEDNNALEFEILEIIFYSFAGFHYYGPNTLQIEVVSVIFIMVRVENDPRFVCEYGWFPTRLSWNYINKHIAY